MKIERLALIGCGLMSGSFALALRAQGLVGQVVAYTPSAATRERALALGVIDQAAQSVAEAAQGADVVLLGVPVATTAQALTELAPVIAAHTLVMDVGSTKGDVVAAARKTLPERLPQFVPAHPIAGKEKAGVAHAEASLYQGRRTILTPLPETDAAQIARATALWQAVGSTVLTMSAAQHDHVFAAVSHLPHLLAFATVSSLAHQSDGAALLAQAGPGFRDATRIAASDATVWRDILLANRAAVSQQVAHLRQSLDQFEAAMHAQDGAALHALIDEASRIRAAWKLTA